jgi:hypothetical protein
MIIAFMKPWLLHSDFPIKLCLLSKGQDLFKGRKCRRSMQNGLLGI